MSATIKVRIVRRCFVSADRVAEVGEVVELDVVQAANLLAGGHEAVDPDACAEAIKQWNTTALRVEAQSQPKAPGPTAWSVFPPAEQRPWARH